MLCELYQKAAELHSSLNVFLALIVLIQSAFILFRIYEDSY
jgi:hypothetical protein